MKFIIFFMILFCNSAYAGEFRHFSEWTPEQKAEFLLFSGVSYIDYAQTTSAVKQRDLYYEINPILGKYPSNESVAILTIVSIAYYYTLIGYSEKYPNISIAGRTAMVSTKVFAVWHNDSIGISVSRAW